MKKVIGTLIFTFLLAGYLTLKNGAAFGSEYNLQNLARLIALLSILAIGEGLVIITGGIDLSIGAIVGYSALLVTYLIGRKDLNPATAILCVLALMGAAGRIQGWLITRLNIQPFIVTLGGMMVLRGLAQVLTGGGAVGPGEGHEMFQNLGGGFILQKIPIPVVIMLAVAAVFYFLMHRTIFGQYLYAIGRNEEAARFSGINVSRYKRLAYFFSALLACLTGILYASYLSSVQTSFGTAYELYGIAAAVLGGCSLRGGEGTIPGIIIGAALMRLIYNAITLLNIPTDWEFVVIGSVILIAALLEVFVRSRESAVETRGGN